MRWHYCYKRLVGLHATYTKNLHCKWDTLDYRVGHFSPYGRTVQTVGLDIRSKLSFGHFGTGAEMLRHVRPIWTVLKCLSADLSRVRSVRLPFYFSFRRDYIFLVLLEINAKNCSLSIVLTATDQKPQKSLKRWYYPPSHCLNVNVMPSNMTFLMIFAVFDPSPLTLWINCSF